MEQLLEAARVRKLDRVGATYAVAAWLMVQGASIALPAFEAPAWALRWLIVAAMAGFPLSLGLAWIAGGRPGMAGALRPLERRDWLLFGLIGLVAALLVVQLTAGFPWRRSVATAAPPSQIASSVAVLPFANLSGDPAKVYFSDGIADQLISELSRTPSLRVAARTSSFAFRSKEVDIKTIAKALNVRTVLEGSVREDGNRVRIAAELVDASNGFQIWSDSYDRNLTNILELQDEIAGAITRALSQRFWGRAVAARGRPKARAIDPEAYRDYLQAEYYLAQRTRDGITRGIDLLTRVTALAPDYAEGFAALADAHSLMALDFSGPQHMAPALAALKKAVALDPANPTALLIEARIGLLQWRWRDVSAIIKRLDRLHVSSAAAWRTRSIFFDYMGLADLALPAQQAAARADPLSFIDRYNLALYNLVVKRYDLALAMAGEASALQPGNSELLSLECRIAAERGQLAAAHRVLTQLVAQAKAGEPPANIVVCIFHIDVAEGKLAEAHQLVEQAAASFPASGVAPTDIAIGYANTADIASAMTWFRRALALRDPQVLPVPYGNPELTKLYADPRWQAFRKDPAIRDWAAARTEIAAQFQIGE